MTAGAWPRRELATLLADAQERKFLAEVWLWLYGVPAGKAQWLGLKAQVEHFLGAKFTAATKGDARSQVQLTELYQQYIILSMTAE